MPGIPLTLIALLATIDPQARVMGPVPPPTAIQSGIDASWARRPLEQLVGADRQVIGRWFDGSRIVGTETATWLSPRLVAAQLGFLATTESWPEGEILHRWRLIRTALAGQHIVLIRTTAYPRQSLGDVTATAAADARFLGLAKATVNGTTTGLFTLVQRQRTRTRDELHPPRWWDMIPELTAIAPRDQRGALPYRPQLGDYYAWDTVLRVPAEAPWRGDITLKLIAPRRERTAVFAARERPAPPTPKFNLDP